MLSKGLDFLVLTTMDKHSLPLLWIAVDSSYSHFLSLPLLWLTPVLCWPKKLMSQWASLAYPLLWLIPVQVATHLTVPTEEAHEPMSFFSLPPLMVNASTSDESFDYANRRSSWRKEEEKYTTWYWLDLLKTNLCESIC